jgi:hypothetical protein
MLLKLLLIFSLEMLLIVRLTIILDINVRVFAVVAVIMA